MAHSNFPQPFFRKKINILQPFPNRDFWIKNYCDIFSLGKIQEGGGQNVPPPHALVRVKILDSCFVAVKKFNFHIVHVYIYFCAKIQDSISENDRVIAFLVFVTAVK